MAGRACEWCGGAINLLREHARFCSPKCRVYANRAAKKTPRLPAELVGQARWVRWGLEARNGKQTKVPLMLSGRRAASNRPATWATFEAVKASAVGDGFGFVVGAGIGCIDLDKCVDESGVIAVWAQEIIDANPNTFTEISVSGTGIHVWGFLSEQAGRKVRDGRNIEVYARDRYIALGTPLQGTTTSLSPLNLPHI